MEAVNRAIPARLHNVPCPPAGRPLASASAEATSGATNEERTAVSAACKKGENGQSPPKHSLESTHGNTHTYIHAINTQATCLICRQVQVGVEAGGCRRPAATPQCCRKRRTQVTQQHGLGLW